MSSRNTIQRKLVYEAMQKLGGHSTADEIYAQVAAHYPSVSRATVYRNLNALASENKILRVPMPNGADRFDCRLTDHQHACCGQCGKIYDADIGDLEEPLLKSAAGIDFKLESFQIFLYGICSACQKNRNRALPPL